ncbi:MAG: MMPL family transporter [Nitrospinaceae bacterium]|nr:MAG: MMPL family transporter [Nitrospinaceae bacterium]
MVLGHPLSCLFLVLLTFGFFASQAPQFKLDASAESLVLENDRDLAYFREITKTYGSSDFVIITYTPFEDLLSDSSLSSLASLRDDLKALPRVDSVISILDVPLLDSPRVTFSELAEKQRTLTTPGVDKTLARKEFTSSPIYRELLVSPDARTAAVLVNFERDETYDRLLNRRNTLREKGDARSPAEAREFEQAQAEFKNYLALALDRQSREIESIRRVIDQYRPVADMFLGGVPMIVSDMVTFINHDIAVFGMGVIFFMIVALGFFFRRVRWVVLPLACCLTAAVGMVGLLGYLDWRVTVISSNFISILLIITMSIIVHLIVRYGELLAENPNENQRALVLDTVRHMVLPCFYTALTTIVAFTSLVVSNIRPVIDFGWIMTIGISVSFLLSFIIFPAVLVLQKPAPSVSDHDSTRALTQAVAWFTLNHRRKVILTCSLVALLSGIGIVRLQVDNRFIDYFKTSTEIYQGMRVIDMQLGGTTPLEVLIEPDKAYYAYLEELKNAPADEEADPFDDPFAAEKPPEQEENFWFHVDPLLQVEKIHDRLETLPEIGKVLSIATITKIIRDINDGKMPDDYDLALIRKLLPHNVQDTFVHPYLARDGNQTRISMRIVEADPSLNRGALIERIRDILTGEMGIAPERIHFTGMAVLYNNMLHSLYTSQILTIGAVFLGILLMFVILFRGVFIALLALVPNMLAAAMILGVMGLVGIPLDMMTITIAAITIGIAVDDTIHYIYRFKEEFPFQQSYIACIDICHASIGRAIYYTSITVTVGFSILSLSNFIPTIYFGLLTGLAMLVALLCNLTLLPLLLLVFKPLGPETSDELVPVEAES